MNSKKCPNCKAQIPFESSICPNCNFDLNNSNHNNVKAPLHFPFWACFLMILIIVNSSALFLSRVSWKEPITAENIIGTYESDENNKIIITKDYAYYFLEDSYECTDLQCPWYVKDDVVYIKLSRLNCEIYAELDTAILTFKADSRNWKDEKFEKISNETEQYIEKFPKTNDITTDLNQDSTITATISGIKYTVPRQFIDVKDSFDDSTAVALFQYINVDSDILTGVLVIGSGKQKTSENDDMESIAKDYVGNMIINSNITYSYATTVKGYNTTVCDISGALNEDSGPYHGLPVVGYIAIINNTNTNMNNYVFYIYTSASHDSEFDAMFNEIINSAK